MALSLLDEQYFKIKYSFGEKTEKTLSLPQLLHALCQDRAFSLPKLQAVQQHGVYSFLANLMALCLDQEIDLDDQSIISVDVLRNKTAEDWKQLLVDLASKDTTAFDLIVEDMSKPAFFQPPTQIKLKGDKELEKKDQPTRETPDNFSITHDKQDFDIKRGRNSKQDIELWIYALIVMQTCCNYGGPNWHRAIKMESGEASRICASYVDTPFFNTRIQRDVPLLLATRSDLIARHEFTSKFKLLWLIERTEENQIELQDCHPLFIECARIYRFTKTVKGIDVLGISRKLDFIKHTREYRGAVGDFWLPTGEKEIDSKNTPSAISLRKDGLGWDYEQTLKIMLNNKSVKTPAVDLILKSGMFKQGLLLLEGISGGQCKTAGFHKRYVVMTKSMVSRFSKASKDVQLAEKLQGLVTKYSEYIVLVWKNLVAAPLKTLNPRGLKWDAILSEVELQYREQVDTLLFKALSDYTEQDEDSSTEDIEKNFVLSLDRLAYEKREQIFQRSFGSSVEQYFYFALLNSTVYKQKFYLNKKISLLEVSPHMNQIQIQMRSRVFAQVSKTLDIIHANAHDGSFRADLRKSRYAAEYNSVYQRLIVEIYGKSLKDANLSEKEIKIWEQLFAWMRDSKPLSSTDDFGTLCEKAKVNERRFISLLQQSEESLIVETEGLLSILKSSKLELSKNAWVDIATLLFSEGTDDEINVRKVLANSYYHATNKALTQTQTKTQTKTQTQTQTKSTDPNNVEQENV